MSDAALIESYEQLTEILPAFLLRCGVAVLCGAIIGIERELKEKPAGFRTNILICLGASIYMAVGLLLRGGSDVDPTRIAAQVVTGVGFLGAGSIIQSRGRVTGLTTAAGIWVVASIGILAGAGFPVLALISSILVLMTLTVLARLEDRFLDKDAADDDADADDGAGR